MKYFNLNSFFTVFLFLNNQLFVNGEENLQSIKSKIDIKIEDPGLLKLIDEIDTKFSKYDQLMSDLKKVQSQINGNELPNTLGEAEKFRDTAKKLLEAGNFILTKKYDIKRAILDIGNQYDKLSNYYKIKASSVNAKIENITNEKKLDPENKQLLTDTLTMLESQLTQGVGVWEKYASEAKNLYKDENIESNFMLLQHEIDVIKLIIDTIDAAIVSQNGAILFDKLNEFHKRFQEIMNEFFKLNEKMKPVMNFQGT